MLELGGQKIILGGQIPQVPFFNEIQFRDIPSRLVGINPIFATMRFMEDSPGLKSFVSGEELIVE